MRRVPAIALAIATGAAFSTANAQLSARQPNTSKITVTSATSGMSGGFLGSDACTSLHTPAGTGSVAGVPFTTGTTGTQGQAEALCLAFGSDDITLDVWYDWTASQTGTVLVQTCGGTTVDTKIAAYPGTGSTSCPANGTALACNDDACGFQSSISWSATSGQTYLLQIGTFPGAAGGSGTFEITEAAPLACGTYDDGVSENSLGLTVGGEIGWLHNQECLQTVTSVETAYGTAAIPGTLMNGAPARIFVYEDTDCDRLPTTPAGGMALRWSLNTTVMNVDTDILNSYPAPMGANVNIATRCSWVMGTCTHVAMQFPAPMDQTIPTPKAWAVGNTAGPINTTDLNSNPLAPVQTTAIGFPAAWLLRAQGMESSGNPFPAVCFGSPSCPCGNAGDGTGGCENSLGQGGAILAGSGVASLGADSFTLTSTRTPNQPGVFFQGDINLGTPLVFGDGLRCCGNNVLRLGTWLPAGNTTNTATGNNIGGNTPPISDIGANATQLDPGETRCYQWWYRNPTGSPCGGSFNTSNAVNATWSA